MNYLEAEKNASKSAMSLLYWAYDFECNSLYVCSLKLFGNFNYGLKLYSTKAVTNMRHVFGLKINNKR